MTTTLRIVLIVVLVLYFALVILLLKFKKLNLKYSLLWLFVGVLMMILVIFPDVLSFVSKVLGFESQMNALFVCAIGFVFALALSLTSIVSKQNERIKNLTQNNALLEQRVRGLEEKLLASANRKDSASHPSKEEAKE